MSRSLALCDQLLAFSLEPNGLKAAKRDVWRSEERGAGPEQAGATVYCGSRVSSSESEGLTSWA